MSDGWVLFYSNEKEECWIYRTAREAADRVSRLSRREQEYLNIATEDLRASTTTTKEERK